MSNREYYHRVMNDQLAAQQAAVYHIWSCQRAKAQTEGPGEWVPRSKVHPSTNIARRAYRNSPDGPVHVYGDHADLVGFGPRHDCEWFFPLDVETAPRIDGPSNIPNVKRGTEQ